MRKPIPLCLTTAVATLVLASALSVGPAMAEQTTIPLMSDSARRAQLDLPVNGQTEAQVRAHFGAPQSLIGPVGQPPIRQMVYPDFIVYLEGNRVIHTVLKPRSASAGQ
ncbi:MAG: hypothetical protein R3303_09985 [Marinobacter sp.]|nr:hypothetical protein [Marinobacter sp.]